MGKGKRPGRQQRARFRELAWPHLGSLLRAAGYLCTDQHAAEDLVQETMIKALEHIDRFETGTDAKAWLMTILRRTHIDLYRANRKREADVSLEAVGDVAEDETGHGRYDEQWTRPQQLLERSEDEVVIDALKQLPEAIRWTLLLTDVEQVEHTTAAEILEVPVGTIKSRAHRGRKMLRDRLFEVAQRRGWVEVDEAAGDE